MIQIAFYILTGYLILITALFGILPSISESYYKLGGVKKFGWLFSVVLLTVGVLLVFSIQHYLIAFSMCGIWFVAFVPNFKDKVANIVHYSFAILIFIPAIIYIWTIGFHFVVIGAVSAVGLCFFLPKTVRVFAVEVILFTL